MSAPIPREEPVTRARLPTRDSAGRTVGEARCSRSPTLPMLPAMRRPQVIVSRPDDSREGAGTMAGDFISTWAWVFWLALILVFVDHRGEHPRLHLPHARARQPRRPRRRAARRPVVVCRSSSPLVLAARCCCSSCARRCCEHSARAAIRRAATSRHCSASPGPSSSTFERRPRTGEARQRRDLDLPPRRRLDRSRPRRGREGRRHARSTARPPWSSPPEPEERPDRMTDARRRRQRDPRDPARSSSGSSC